jgi:hypothetical protein
LSLARARVRRPSRGHGGVAKHAIQELRCRPGGWPAGDAVLGQTVPGHGKAILEPVLQLGDEAHERRLPAAPGRAGDARRHTMTPEGQREVPAGSPREDLDPMLGTPSVRRRKCPRSVGVHRPRARAGPAPGAHLGRLRGSIRPAHAFPSRRRGKSPAVVSAGERFRRITHCRRRTPHLLIPAPEPPPWNRNVRLALRRLAMIRPAGLML